MQLIIKILRKPITSTIIAILCGFFVASIILSLAGYNSIQTINVMFNGVFSRPKSIANVIIKSTPIILTGLSVAFAFKTGLFNIGAEGQYIMGTIFAVIMGIQFDFVPYIQVPLVIFSGMIAGALYGGIVGLLKSKFGIHEVITSIMLNWIALYMSNFIANTSVFHKPNTTGTYVINESSFTQVLYKWKTSRAGIAYLKNNSFLSDILLRTDLNYGIIIAIVLAIFISFFLLKTTKGFELRAVGLNNHASEFAGIDVKKNILHSMLIAGALSGLAGALTITGMSPHNISTISVFEGNGLNGLSVALIANSSPIGCIFAGLLFSGLIYGGQSVQSEVGVPSEIINIMIGTIVFFVALTRLIPQLANVFEKKVGKKNAN